jgi:hypothetical protein
MSFVDNEWPCIVPGRRVGEWSLSSFEFGRKMAWLVSSKFYDLWKDRDLTKCATIRLVIAHSLIVFCN